MANHYIYKDDRKRDCLGMYTDDGLIYDSRAFFDGYTPDMSHCVGCIDSSGYVYSDIHKRDKIGMIDHEGRVYRGYGLFYGSTPSGTAPLGYVGHDGDVYDKVSAFTDTAPSSFPVAWVEPGSNRRIVGAAVLLLGLPDPVSMTIDPPSSSSSSSESSGTYIPPFLVPISLLLFVLMLGMIGQIKRWIYVLIAGIILAVQIIKFFAMLRRKIINLHSIFTLKRLLRSIGFGIIWTIVAYLVMMCLSALFSYFGFFENNLDAFECTLASYLAFAAGFLYSYGFHINMRMLFKKR